MNKKLKNMFVGTNITQEDNRNPQSTDYVQEIQEIAPTIQTFYKAKKLENGSIVIEEVKGWINRELALDNAEEFKEPIAKKLANEITDGLFNGKTSVEEVLNSPIKTIIDEAIEKIEENNE